MTHSWHTSELARALEIPPDEVRRRLFTLGVSRVAPDRYPIIARALLTAQSQNKAICRRCYRTGDPGPCPCRKGRIERLPEPEPAA